MSRRVHILNSPMITAIIKSGRSVTELVLFTVERRATVEKHRFYMHDSRPCEWAEVLFDLSLRRAQLGIRPQWRVGE